VANEYIQVINAALAHKDYKVDIVEAYTLGFHEKIIDSLRSFYQKNMKTLTHDDIHTIANFLAWYKKRLSIFGPACRDKRLT